MSRALLILNGQEARRKAAGWIAKAPINTRVTFQGPKRSVPQNDKMWAALTDFSEQLSWHGRKLLPHQWKKMFLRELNSELLLVPNFSNNGYIDIGESSSDLDKEEMSNLIELIHAKGAEYGVTFNEPAQLETV